MDNTENTQPHSELSNYDLLMHIEDCSFQRSYVEKGSDKVDSYQSSLDGFLEAMFSRGFDTVGDLIIACMD